MDTFLLLNGRMRLRTTFFTVRTTHYLVISVLITIASSTNTSSTTMATDGDDEVVYETYFPQSVLVLIGLGLCLLIGAIVAKLVDKLHDRISLRDDASDMSEHTRDLLKARFALSAFTNHIDHEEVRDTRTRQIDRARKFGRLWMAQAANARRKKRELKVSVGANDNHAIEPDKLSPKVALVSYKPKEDTIKETKEEYDASEKDTNSDKDFVSIDMTMGDDPGQIAYQQTPKREDHIIEFRDIGDGVTIPVRVPVEDKESTCLPLKVDLSSNGRIPSAKTVSTTRKSDDLKEFSSSSDFNDYDDSNISERGSPEKSETPAPKLNASKPKSGTDIKAQAKKSASESAVSLSKDTNAASANGPVSKPVKDAWKEPRPTTAKSKSPAPPRPASSAAKSPKPMRPVSSKAGSRPLTAGSRKITPGGRKGSIRGGGPPKAR